MRQRLVRFIHNLPIARKLLLASVIPLAALGILVVLTFRSVQTFAEDEEHLNQVYLAQRTASEYMRHILDLETGFRGFVLTQQERYLEPYRTSHERVRNAGEALALMAGDRPAQAATIRQTQQLVQQLIEEKDALIQSVKEGRTAEARHYIEQGRGRALMVQIRDLMNRFDSLEQEQLSHALKNLADDRRTMITHILGGFLLALALMVLALQLIARSITGPLVALASSVHSSKGALPQVTVLERRDEIGELTRVIESMSTEVRRHVAQLEQSEAALLTVNADLTESESKYRSIVDHAPFGIFTTQGMAMTFVNRYNRLLAGLDPEDEGDPEEIREAIHPEDRERVLNQFSRAVEEGRPCETVFRFLHRDGTVRKVLSRRVPIRDADGKVLMYQGFNVDITALDQLQARLSRAERLATLGQVAAGIAHEIRNPLVGIGSTTSLLLDDTPEQDARRADLAIILQETKRLDRIVNQIIDYARPREIAPVLFALSDMIQETVKLLEAPLAAKRLSVGLDVPPTLSPLHADRDQLKQVLLNVVQNAIDAVDGEGSVIEIVATDSGTGVAMTVSDSGRGIKPEDVPRVFEPFFTSGKRQGTGLGLAICRNIIEAHGGDITLTSETGKGTTVRIWLPLRQQPRLVEA